MFCLNRSAKRASVQSQCLINIAMEILRAIIASVTNTTALALRKAGLEVDSPLDVSIDYLTNFKAFSNR